MKIVGNIINNKYRLLEKFGEDFNGFFYAAEDIEDSKKKYSIYKLKESVISNKNQELIRFREELRKVIKLNHQNIFPIVKMRLVE